MNKLRFKRCRLLEGNVWKKELTIIQRRILRRLRKRKISMKIRIHSRKNLNSYIQLQTTRKLCLFYGDLPITEMHRRFKETSYIPFLLNLETRLDVILVRCHFCESLRQARLLISHRKVCVNQEIVEHCHWKVSHGDIISFQEDYARIRGEEIRRFFYIESLLEERIGDFLNRPVRMWRRTKIKWYNLLKTKRGCRIVLEESFLQKLRSSMQKEDFEKTKKLFLGRLHRNFAEHKRKRRNLYHSKFLSKRTKDQKLDIPSLRIRSALLDFLDSFSLDRNSTDCSASDHEFTRKIKRLTKKMSRDIISKSKKLPNRYKKRVELPTHYSEVNYRTLKAVVFYRPNIGNIPHDIRLKDLNLLL